MDFCSFIFISLRDLKGPLLKGPFVYGHPYTTFTKIGRLGVVEIGLFRTLGGEGVLGFLTSEIFMRNSWLLF